MRRGVSPLRWEPAKGALLLYYPSTGGVHHGIGMKGIFTRCLPHSWTPKIGMYYSAGRGRTENPRDFFSSVENLGDQR